MEHSYRNARVVLVRGDITEQTVDAIVNAANRELEPGSGVCGAIHAKGGPTIAEEGRAFVAEHGPLADGGVAVTTAGALSAKHVIHAAGPVWVDGMQGENVALEHAYYHAMEAAAEAGDRTIAFPAISTGVYGFPLEPAAMIAIGTVFRFLRTKEGALDEVRLVLFSDEDYAAYERILSEIVRTHLAA